MHGVIQGRVICWYRYGYKNKHLLCYIFCLFVVYIIAPQPHAFVLFFTIWTTYCTPIQGVMATGLLFPCKFTYPVWNRPDKIDRRSPTNFLQTQEAFLTSSETFLPRQLSWLNLWIFIIISALLYNTDIQEKIKKCILQSLTYLYSITQQWTNVNVLWCCLHHNP